MTNIAYSDGSSIGRTYDADGNILSLTDPSGSTSFAYDALGRLAGETHPNKGGVCSNATVANATICYTYDGADNLLSKSDAGGTTSYAYTANNELASVTDPQNAKTSFGYDQDGNLTSIAYPNGITHTVQYDAGGQLTKISATTGAGTVLASSAYSFTKPTTNKYTATWYGVTDQAGNSTSYAYDALGQLTGATQRNSVGSQIASYSYAYDPVGNMTSENLNGAVTAMSYNAADELTAAGARTYSYDANGNETGISGGTSFAYNVRDQTTSMTPAGASSIPMAYTGEGQTERISSGPTSWQYDETGLGAMTAGAGTTYFTNAPGGKPISERTPTGTYYYLYDGMGSVVGLADSRGNVVNRYRYDPYGTTTSVSESVTNPFRYAGAVWDSANGLYKMGERYYDPGTGRYTQLDPLGEGYRYAGDNPVNFVDSCGLSSSPPDASGLDFSGFQNGWDTPRAGNVGTSSSPADASWLDFSGYQSGWDASQAVHGRWHCRASCHEVRHGGHVVGFVYGEGSGNSQRDACQAAMNDAKSHVRTGHYPRHCHCYDCKKR